MAEVLAKSQHRKRMFQFELVFGSVGDISKVLWDCRVRLKGSGLQKPEPFIRETVIH
jgi:hypothetical protein